MTPINVDILIKSDIIGFYYHVLCVRQYTLYPLDFSWLKKLLIVLKANLFSCGLYIPALV